MSINRVMRKLPKVADLLDEPEISLLCETQGRNRVLEVLRHSIDIVRQDLFKSISDDSPILQSGYDLKKRIISLVTTKVCKSPFTFRTVINATGVVLHTNLGRAPLPKQVLERVAETAVKYSNLEYDVENGERGDRYGHISELLCQITGAEDALVVNNNAAAVLLCLLALAAEKEVIISRGQLVEIGGSFRIPDVMALSGSRLVEVGTTNKTHLKDYEKAINEETAMLLKVHTSNFKVIGFTSHVKNTQLLALGQKYNIPVMEDLGSGILVDLRPYGFPYEPTVSDSVKAGIDLVTFSGDKLLGGPQAGIILGKRELISRIKVHPFMRAVRIDKMTLAALEAILLLYKNCSWGEIPTLYMLTKSMETMKTQAQLLYKGLSKVIGNQGYVDIIDGYSEAGGGSFPGYEIPTKVVAVYLKNISAQEFSKKLRQASIPIIGRIKKDRFLLDVRTMYDEDIVKTVKMVDELL